MIKCAYLRYSIIFFFSILFPLSVSSFANAADNIWLGSSSTFASDGSNWSLNRAPLTGDNVIFTNNSYSYECTWDITANPDLGSFTMNNYAGTVTLSQYLTVSGDIDVNLGTLMSSGSQVITVGGDWNFFTGLDTPLGDVSDPIGFPDGIPDGLIDVYDATEILNMSMGTASVKYCSDINTDGVVNILDVVLSLRVSNNLDNSQVCTGGIFSPGTSTVSLTGINQTIYGDNIFFNLEKIISSAITDNLYFEAGSIQTILGKLKLNGYDSNNRLVLDSHDQTNYWFIDPQGPRNIAFASIRYMYNRNFVNIAAIDSQDGGNNIGVQFGGSLCVCNDNKLILACAGCDKRRLTW